jgi:hypothetical protein
MCCALYSVSVIITQNMRMLSKLEFLVFLDTSAYLKSAPEYRATTVSAQVSLGWLCLHASFQTARYLLLVFSCNLPKIN